MGKQEEGPISIYLPTDDPYVVCRSRRLSPTGGIAFGNCSPTTLSTEEHGQAFVHPVWVTFVCFGRGWLLIGAGCWLKTCVERRRPFTNARMYVFGGSSRRTSNNFVCTTFPSKRHINTLKKIADLASFWNDFSLTSWLPPLDRVDQIRYVAASLSCFSTSRLFEHSVANVLLP